METDSTITPFGEQELSTLHQYLTDSQESETPKRIGRPCLSSSHD